ncbi:MAG: sulfatase family protein [Planctomycetota bacterium]|jgi:arylsulfatase A-like enzyme
MRHPVAFAVVVLVGLSVSVSAHAAVRPNVILVMADDLGWGDVAYNGHPVLRTPHLDALAASGVVLDRFYAQSPVCSPTRASCLTGRHPYRAGITGANTGHLPQDAVTLTAVLAARGYRTGHFGKWHLGTLTTEIVESNRGGPRGAAHYAPPWEREFDACFSTEAKVPTWNPMEHPQSGAAYGTHYWTGPGVRATGGLEGDDSRIIMDRAAPFVRSAAADGVPFFAVIWFHTPHLPVLAGPEHRALYEGEPLERQHYFGAITAMDEQIGRLIALLDEAGARGDTLIWFCSDNGPEGVRETVRRPGSTGGLRGRKRSLHEGGIRVPGIVSWPAGLAGERKTAVPCSTSDMLPTIADALGAADALSDVALDGRSALPVLRGERERRGRAIGFVAGRQAAWIGDRWKLITTDRGATWTLYDLAVDPVESIDLAAAQPAVRDRMRNELLAWLAEAAPNVAWPALR